MCDFTSDLDTVDEKEALGAYKSSHCTHVESDTERLNGSKWESRCWNSHDDELERKRGERTFHPDCDQRIPLYSELHFLLLRGSSKDKRLFLVSSEIMARQNSSGYSSPDLGIVVSQLRKLAWNITTAESSRIHDSLLRQKSSLPTITLDASVTQQHLREIGGQK